MVDFLQTIQLQPRIRKAREERDLNELVAIQNEIQGNPFAANTRMNLDRDIAGFPTQGPPPPPPPQRQVEDALGGAPVFFPATIPFTPELIGQMFAEDPDNPAIIEDIKEGIRDIPEGIGNLFRRGKEAVSETAGDLLIKATETRSERDKRIAEEEIAEKVKAEREAIAATTGLEQSKSSLQAALGGLGGGAEMFSTTSPLPASQGILEEAKTALTEAEKLVQGVPETDPEVIAEQRRNAVLIGIGSGLLTQQETGRAILAAGVGGLKAGEDFDKALGKMKQEAKTAKANFLKTKSSALVSIANAQRGSETQHLPKLHSTKNGPIVQTFKRRKDGAIVSDFKPFRGLKGQGRLSLFNGQKARVFGVEYDLDNVAFGEELELMHALEQMGTLEAVLADRALTEDVISGVQESVLRLFPNASQTERDKLYREHLTLALAQIINRDQGLKKDILDQISGFVGGGE